jgi:hypothetical protein
MTPGNDENRTNHHSNHVDGQEEMGETPWD